VPLLCSFNLRLFTRERLPSQTTTTTTSLSLNGSHQTAVTDETSNDGEVGTGSSRVVSHVGGLSAARPACSRVLRVEPLTHTIMTSPGWRTLLLTWNDHSQNWIKTGASMHTCKRRLTARTILAFFQLPRPTQPGHPSVGMAH